MIVIRVQKSDRALNFRAKLNSGYWAVLALPFHSICIRKTVYKVPMGNNYHNFYFLALVFKLCLQKLKILNCSIVCTLLWEQHLVIIFEATCVYKLNALQLKLLVKRAEGVDLAFQSWYWVWIVNRLMQEFPKSVVKLTFIDIDLLRNSRCSLHAPNEGRTFYSDFTVFICFSKLCNLLSQVQTSFGGLLVS